MLSGTKGKNVLAFSEILHSHGKETRALWPRPRGPWMAHQKTAQTEVALEEN